MFFRLVIFHNCFYKSPFASKFSCMKTSSQQGKKEVACIVSKPLVSCLWRCGESVNPPKLNIQEVQGALSSRPKGDPGPLPIFQDFLRLSNHTPGIYPTNQIHPKKIYSKKSYCKSVSSRFFYLRNIPLSPCWFGV